MAKGLPLLVMGCLALCLPACGRNEPAKVRASGQLLRNNQPLKLNTQVMKNMVFHPYEAVKQDQHYNTYSAMVEEDGTFKSEVDMPPGKYLITLELLDAPGDLCKGLFATKENSKLVREVTGKESLKIEITKPTGE